MPEFVCNASWPAGWQQEMEAIIWPADAFVKLYKLNFIATRAFVLRMAWDFAGCGW
jgi:hypothetical protein